MAEGSSRGKRPDRSEARLFGAPEPEAFRETLEGRALAATAEIHFSERSDQDRLLALEKLALDVFDDAAAARAFVVNPEAYLRRAGFEGVTLDPSSPEVRVAMALGDPDVRRAAQRGDVEAFIDAIRAQGIEPDQPLMPIATFELAALLSAVAVTWAAVGYSVYAGMMVRTAAGLWTKVAAWGGRPPVSESEHLRTIQSIAEEVATPTFAQAVGARVVERMLEEYARVHAAAPELLDDLLTEPERRSLRGSEGRGGGTETS